MFSWKFSHLSHLCGKKLLDKEVGNELHAIVPQIDDKSTRGARTKKMRFPEDHSSTTLYHVTYHIFNTVSPKKILDFVKDIGLQV